MYLTDYILFNLAIIKASKLTTTTTSREDITTKAWTELNCRLLDSNSVRRRFVEGSLRKRLQRAIYERLISGYITGSARKCIRTFGNKPISNVVKSVVGFVESRRSRPVAMYGGLSI
jgi:uncharacterized protein (DUF488 family)